MRRQKKIVIFGFAALGAALVVAGLFCLGWNGVQASQDRAQGSDERPVVLEVSVECEGWTEESAQLGVFISGVAADGSLSDEQVTFEGSGEQGVAVLAGAYEVAAQLPSFMLADGTVLCASDPVRVWCSSSEGIEASAIIRYAPAPMRELTDEQLLEVARASFLEEARADDALQRAKLKRDAAPAPDLSTPDIEGDIGEGGKA